MFSSVARVALCGNPSPSASSAPHPNEAWWASQVCCARAEVVEKEEQPSSSTRNFAFDRGAQGVLNVRVGLRQLRGPPHHLLGKDLQRTITAFVEVRQPYWRQQPESFPTFHALMILELDGGAMFLLLERKTDMLEMVIGDPGIPLGAMKAFRAVGGCRNIRLCVEQPRQELRIQTSVYQLLEWIDGPVEEGWAHYDILQANCQHFARELQQYLLQPFDTSTTMPFQVAPLSDKRNRELVLAAVRQDWHALKYATEDFRQDRKVVLAAVERDGRALRYAHANLRLDKEVVMAAVRQNGSALPYVEGHLRQDREVVLAAVRSRGFMLCYASEEHRLDREVALAAVQSDGYAVRYVAGKLRSDAQILLAAAWQNPVAVGRLPFF